LLVAHIRVFCLALCLCVFPLFSQQAKSGPKEKSFKQELKTNKQLRKEARAKRRLEKAERKAIKAHHKRIQTKAVRKRMKSSSKQSKRYNTNKKEFFLTRWYKNKVNQRKRSR
jgi:hypothetical protein